ncbi:DNA-3-methyladenine glycosylase [Lutibaculum baratangense]|uniref:Putative 3-methyladenine DNA glycosylase n=1 Tax=Lutibaculum baratangense AMV1 TaxID=631454 RepID=V4QUK3_9HYPH|nr:DNA-3-methyladenine glycosylase [Lutibaculum baratangense]ESR23407.1 DNA-3-methyladenine glycosylase II [Lutibaculum baratangense AMV1]
MKRSRREMGEDDDRPALPAGFFAGPAPDVARGLIGATLLVGGVGGVIVETEAYVREDPASHSFAGRTERNAAMFGPVGRAYVYRSYGIHWCLNFVCDEAQEGSAVLIRAVEPTNGIEIMRERRGLQDMRLLCAGPGRLCQALAVTRDEDKAPLDAPPFVLLPRQAEVEIGVGPRIGITKAAEKPWRFAMAGSRYLSRPMKPLLVEARA